MQIATWNVNSLRVRLEQLLEWLAVHQPEIVALQETKVTDQAFPLAQIERCGYGCVFNGQKSYNGVATLARRPLSEAVLEIPSFDDQQRRVLAVSCDGVRVVNLYVPNGQSVASDKYEYKLRWLKALRIWLREELARYAHLVVLGDFNIAPEDRDVHDPQAWVGSVLVSEPEREALRELLHIGLSDVFRKFEQPPQSFSWWDYRAAALRRNQGLRIDRAPRLVERASDHTPVLASFDI